MQHLICMCAGTILEIITKQTLQSYVTISFLSNHMIFLKKIKETQVQFSCVAIELDHNLVANIFAWTRHWPELFGRDNLFLHCMLKRFIIHICLFSIYHLFSELAAFWCLVIFINFQCYHICREYDSVNKMLGKTENWVVG